MTTYNSYAEAKIANPEREIARPSEFWDGADYIVGKFKVLTESMLIDKFSWEKCNPADHCMTVERFLADGHKFVCGDIVIDVGEVSVIETGFDRDSYNDPDEGDYKIYILRAAALENIPTETPEEKEVLDGIESAGEVEWSNGDSVKYHNKHEGEGGLLTFVGIHPTHKDHAVLYGKHLSCGYMSAPLSMLSKPEAPQQREDRERLEAAYDLYEESQHAIGCIGYDDFDFFKKSDIQVKFWLAIVDKANYRKEKTHGTN